MPLYPRERIDDLRGTDMASSEGRRLLLRNGCGALSSFCESRKGAISRGSWVRAPASSPYSSRPRPGPQDIRTEIQPEVAEIAEKKVCELNGLSRTYNHSKRRYKGTQELSFQAYRQGRCGDINPYMKKESGLKNPGDSKIHFRHELYCDLGDVCQGSLGSAP